MKKQVLSDLPGPDIQFTPVDDAGELKEYREPSAYPHTVLRRYIHVITGVILKGLQRNDGYAHSYDHYMVSNIQREQPVASQRRIWRSDG